MLCSALNSPRGSLLGIPVFSLLLLLNPNVFSLLWLVVALLTDLLCPDPWASSIGLVPGLDPSPGAAAEVKACEERMSISSKSSWVKSSSSPNGSSKATAVTTSWPRRRLVGGQFMLWGRNRKETGRLTGYNQPLVYNVVGVASGSYSWSSMSEQEISSSGQKFTELQLHMRCSSS